MDGVGDPGLSHNTVNFLISTCTLYISTTQLVKLCILFDQVNPLLSNGKPIAYDMMPNWLSGEEK